MSKQKLKKGGSVWHDRTIKKVSIDAQSERILCTLKWRGHEVGALLLSFGGGTVTIPQDKDKPIKISGVNLQITQQ